MLLPLLRLMMTITTLGVLLIGGVRLLPADLPDTSPIADLFLKTADCPPGCLLGIPTETTRLFDAVERLQAHEWVGGVYGGWQEQVFHPDVTVRWRWSGAQPAFIDARVPGVMLAQSFGYGGDQGHVVTSFTIATRWRLYDLQQTLGPTADGLARFVPAQDAIEYAVSYHDPATFTRTTLTALLPCPVHLMTYWQAFATLDIRSGYLLTPYVPPERLPDLCAGG